MPSSAIEMTSAVPATGGFYPLRVCAVTPETRVAIVVEFEVPADWEDKFRFTQGQHLTLRAHIDGEEVRRSYSICSAVQDGTLRVAIKRVSNGLFSNWAFENLKPGSTIEVMPPSGQFFTALSPDSQKNYVAFAAGSGITPILSIIKTTLLTEPRSDFTLFYGNRSSGSVIFREELADLKDTFLGRFNLVHIMTREHQDLELFNGRITAEKCEALLRQWCSLEGVDTVFLCGPQAMSAAISEQLKSMNFPESRIKVELFSADPLASAATRKRAVVAAPSADTHPCEATIIVDGRERVVNMTKGNETILDAALRNGVELRYSCKSGVCATCRAKLLAGQVDMDANYALEDYEVRRGFILTCQSYPLTDQVTVDFDQDS
jgi:ring-1,2-phenylacetyl-CoA epoxidase subunit PaaE